MGDLVFRFRGGAAATACRPSPAARADTGSVPLVFIMPGATALTRIVLDPTTASAWSCSQQYEDEAEQTSTCIAPDDCGICSLGRSLSLGLLLLFISWAEVTSTIAAEYYGCRPSPRQAFRSSGGRMT